MTLAPGSRFGPYDVISRLGAGGMGEVWRARDSRLEREVALKVLPAAVVADDTARARLLREARTAAKLNHPSVCSIHEVGEAEGQAYIAMELVAGQTLSDRLMGARMAVEDVVRLGQQMADALAHAHEHSVVHRDFKSANVIVTPEGRAKVLDFGLAKPLLGKELEAATTLTQASLTEAGAVVGTLAYMAPEQLRGRPADARSDIWALGVVLYEMVSGARPFAGQTGFELSSAILNQAPKALPAGVPAPLGAIIERCLAKEPSQRYQRAGEVRSALEAMLTGSAPAAWPGWRASLVTHRAQVALAVLSSVIVILAGLDVGGVRSRLLGRGEGGRAIRMAVLPFANLSGDPEQEYLSDGLTQEMIAQLGRLHPETLSVIARTSVMRYKKAETPIDQIGRELEVDYILEGSARRQGSRVRIAAELIRVKGQAQLWADTYERELADTLVLESEVAQKVAGALALKLLPSERTRLAAAHTVNPAAYDAYLKGSQYYTRLTAADLDTAERYLNLALEKDPSFAPAHAGLALVWILRQQMGFAPPSEAGPKAKEAARQAVELDDTVAAGHVTLAIVLTWTDWNFAAARGEWARALELDPSNSQARAFYAHYLLAMGRHDEAMAQIEAALQGDPFNAMIRSFYSVDLMWTGRYEEALTAARDVLRLQPDEPAAVNVVWLTSARLGRQKEAIEAAREYVSAIYQDPNAGRACDESYAQGGYTEAMRRVAEALAARFRTSFAVTTDVAFCYLEAGDKARALDWLEKGYEVRDPSMPVIGMRPFFDALRSDPRYQALLRKMNLPLTIPAGTPQPMGGAT